MTKGHLKLTPVYQVLWGFKDHPPALMGSGPILSEAQDEANFILGWAAPGDVVIIQERRGLETREVWRKVKGGN